MAKKPQIVTSEIVTETHASFMVFCFASMDIIAPLLTFTKPDRAGAIWEDQKASGRISTLRLWLRRRVVKGGRRNSGPQLPI